MTASVLFFRLLQDIIIEDNLKFALQGYEGMKYQVKPVTESWGS